MGFLGLGDYATGGKGVKKDKVKKKAFFDFMDKLARNCVRMLKLHFIYLLFCIPIITIGPATVALVKIMHQYVQEKPVFMFSDFLKEFKLNFKQGVFLGIINISLSIIIYLAIDFYASYRNVGWYMYVLIVIAMFVFLLYLFSLCYSYLLCGLMNMSLFHILKNSFILGIVGMKSNFLTVIFNIIIALPAAFLSLIFPWFFLVLAPHAVFAFTCSYNSFKYVHRYIIKPYYEANGKQDPYLPQENQDVIFTDAVELETTAAKKEKKKKTIS